MYGKFVWWTGVVEDRIDPLKLGRCRVRVLGYHTDKKGIDHIPTNTLPWATPSQPITSGAMNGIGTTPMGPVEGTWVFGFFRDGKKCTRSCNDWNIWWNTRSRPKSSSWL